MQKDALALILLLAVLVIGLIGAALWLSGSNRRAALAARGRQEGGGSGLRALLARADDSIRRTRRGQQLAQWLRSSGGPLTPIDAVAIVLVGGLLLGTLLLLLATPVVAYIFGYVAVVLGMRWYVERGRARRKLAFMDQLPELARMLSNGAQAGLSIPGAVQMAARELDNPAAEEMAAVVQEMRLGQPLDRALERLQERLPSREIAVLMTTIIIQQRAGGDTVRALQELGGTLEARKDLIREVRTVLSGSVYTSYIVAGIGIAAILLMNLFMPGVMREMTSSLAGIVALCIAGMLWAIAFVLIRATTRMDI